MTPPDRAANSRNSVRDRRSTAAASAALRVVKTVHTLARHNKAIFGALFVAGLLLTLARWVETR